MSISLFICLHQFIHPLVYYKRKKITDFKFLKLDQQRSQKLYICEISSQSSVLIAYGDTATRISHCRSRSRFNCIQRMQRKFMNRSSFPAPRVRIFLQKAIKLGGP